MKLVYVWIEEYLNIKDQGLNLGSEWVYNHQFKLEARTLNFDRTANVNFLPNLFSLGGPHLENVTAIIGGNGSGKTNILEFLGYAIKEDSGFEGRLVFEDEVGNIFIKPMNSSEASERFSIKKGIDFDVLTVKATFDFSDLVNGDRPEVIYYSPIYDFRTGTSENNKWINVSSNYLIRNDGQDRRASHEENFSSTGYHRVCEIQRQLRFLANIEGLGLKNNLSEITFPDQISVNFVSIHVPYKEDLSEPYNFPIQFRSFLNEAFAYNRRNIWGKEIDTVTNQEYQELQDGEISRYDIQDKIRLHNIIRWKTFVFALKNVFAAIIENADSDPGNVLLNKSFANAIKEVELDEFSNELDYAELKPKNESNFERFLTRFLSNQDALNFEPILVLFGEIKAAIFSSEIEDWSVNDSRCRILMSLGSVYPLLEAYSKVLKQHTFIPNIPMSWGFIDFEWHGMSSGEIAFLSLFSRLHLAEDLILAKTENAQFENDKKPHPESVIILIDEGEQGFHLQWQKRYISLLVESLPRLFKPDVKIQLIFATHSPIALSDIPSSHIVLLKKDLISREIQITDASALSVNTFAANIYDILKDAYFLSEGFMGNFAETKINRLISYLREALTEEIINEVFSESQPREGVTQKRHEFNEESAKRLIQIVDEPILRRKLWELYGQKFAGLSEADRIKEEIKKLQSRLKSISVSK